MKGIYRIYLMARIIDEDVNNLGIPNPYQGRSHTVYRDLLVKQFLVKYKKYDSSIANKTLISAVKNGYIESIPYPYSNSPDAEQKIAQVKLNPAKGQKLVEKVGIFPIGLFEEILGSYSHTATFLVSGLFIGTLGIVLNIFTNFSNWIIGLF